MNISKDLSPDIFHAVGVSLGVFGIITEVTLSVEELMNLEEKRVSLPLRKCVDNLQDISTAAEFVKLWIELNSEVCYVHSSNKSSQEKEQNYSDFVQGIKVEEYCIGPVLSPVRYLRGKGTLLPAIYGHC